MPRAVNNLQLSYSEIPIKTFIKETCQVDSSTQSKTYNFECHQAQEAYNEIISQTSQTRPLLQKKSTSCRWSNNNLRNLSKTNNVNTLFKAVELGDKDFVYQNFNSENVNISDQFGWTPLMSAACSGHTAIVDFLLTLGADAKIKDKSGLSAIHLASKKNHIEIVNLLGQTPKNSDSALIKKDELDGEINHVEGFYCEICETKFISSSRKEHESSTVHIFNCKPKIANVFYGIPKQNRGYQMLLSRGWNEEGGLGPTGEGQKYPVKTVLKRDRKGFSESLRKFARVTHFDPNDAHAVRSVYKKEKRMQTKRNRKKQLSKEAAKTRAWRQAI